MNIRTLQQQIGQTQQQATKLGQSLELSDRIADTWEHPERAHALLCSARLRLQLRVLFTRLHYLESRIPTPETLSHAAYDRALMLGLSIEAAEAERVTTYRHALMDRARRAA